jgi:hypothetical protein
MSVVYKIPQLIEGQSEKQWVPSLEQNLPTMLPRLLCAALIGSADSKQPN